MKYYKVISDKQSILSGKTVFLTGAAGGLGRPLCRFLAGAGATLILGGRDVVRYQALIAELQAEFAGLQAEFLPLDLEDFSSVAACARALQDRPLDILIHNAGAYSIPRKTCKTGFDNVFQINFLSPYYLTKELLPVLRSRKGLVVAVGSIAYRYSKTDPEDLDFSTRNSSALVYGNSKRMLMFSLGALLAAEKDIRFSLAHPGISFTNITAHYPKLLFALIKHPMKILFMKPRKACLSIIRALFDPCGEKEWIGPRFFDIWGLPKKKRLNGCSKEERRFISKTAETCYDRMKRLTLPEP